jgi:hypothetical protein
VAVVVLTLGQTLLVVMVVLILVVAVVAVLTMRTPTKVVTAVQVSS